MTVASKQAPQCAMKRGCPICCASDVVEQRQLNDSQVFRCSHCSVEFLDPQPTPEALAAIYSVEYFFTDSEGVSETEVSRLKRRTAELYVNKLLAARGGRKGMLLEIGSGGGDFLVAAQARGFQVKGIEISEYATALANRRLGSDVVERGEVDTVGLPEGTVDVVVCSDVVEHVRDPKAFLERISACLRPCGLLFLATPSTDSWSRRLMGKRWMEYKTEHLFYFNRRSLDYLLTRCGFQSIDFHRNFKTLSFNYVRVHFKRYPVPIWSRSVEIIRRVIPDALAEKAFTLVASGVIATACKSG